MSFSSMTSVGNSNTALAASNQPFQLREGQLVHGQIKQLYPNQMAEVQIGQQKLHAQLETPLRAGDAYYFQIQATEPEVQLKIIAGPLHAKESPATQLNQLMDSMQLPKTSEMRSLLSFALQHKLPMNREQLLQAATLLKDVSPAAKEAALQTIQRLIDLKLPLSEQHFRSFLSVELKEGLTHELTNLRSAILSDNTMASSLRSSLLTTLTSISQPLAHALGTALLGEAMAKMLDEGTSQQDRFNALQLLKQAEVLPTRSSLANIGQVLHAAMMQSSETNASWHATILNRLQQLVQSPTQTIPTTSNELQSIVTREPTLTMTEREILQNAILQASRTALEQPTTGQKQLFSETIMKALASTVAQQTSTTAANTSTASQTPLNALFSQQSDIQIQGESIQRLVHLAEQSTARNAQQLLQHAEQIVVSTVDGKAMKAAVQQVLTSLGINYEAALLRRDADIPQLLSSLKPQLVALLEQSAISPAVRDAAETMLFRLQAPVLQSGEAGLQHQLMMQIPLDLFGKKIDATLEWNGRLKEDGKIDPDFARVLFYLDLSSLQHTVVDMQVQNRVISLTVFNEYSAIEQLGKSLIPSLKERLQQMNYQLSGIAFKSFMEEQVVVTEKSAQKLEDGHQGVDMRI